MKTINEIIKSFENGKMPSYEFEPIHFNHICNRIANFFEPGELDVFYLWGNLPVECEREFVGSCRIDDIGKIFGEEIILDQIELVVRETGETFRFSINGNIYQTA